MRVADAKMDPTRGPRMLIVVGLAVALASCLESTPPREVANGDPDRGPRAIRVYGCGACHTIPGVDGADGVVAPPLTRFAERAYIGGVVSNQPDTLVQWIRDPRSIDPRTAMPNLGVSEQDARDIAAYLYTLR